MIYFNSDYLEGAHPSIMVRLAETNMVQTVGYGEDEYCEAAREKIKTACQAPEADVHFLVGGTQTNTTVIAAILRPWQGVISAVSGHINCHEAGAIESTGHKVITLPTTNGKITAQQVQDYVEWHRNDESTEHIVQPGMVYISHPTEGGTLYTKAELTALYDTCRRYGLPLFIDGARLGYGLMAEESDMTLPEIARLCDVFYIGGTKVGALFGEAVVIMNENLKKDFRFIMKQRGGRMAKGRLLGVQFQALLKDDLYFDIGRHANDMAFRLRDGFKALGYEFPVPSPSNQQFPVMKIQTAEKLAAMGFEFQVERVIDEEHIMYRFVTSWATPESAIDDLLNALAQCQ